MKKTELDILMKTVAGYGVIPNNSENCYFYEVFPGDTHKETLERIFSHGHTPDNALILHYNDFFDITFKIDKVYKVSEEYAKKHDLLYMDRITKSVYEAKPTYQGAQTIDCALSY